MKATETKKTEKTEKAGTGIQFIELLSKNWYNKEGTKKLTIVESVDDLISGKSENYDFTEKLISTKRDIFVLFKLINGNYLLLKRRNKIK
jgi:hypothetical protein